jgi:SAM-dependent methyltransferase
VLDSFQALIKAIYALRFLGHHCKNDNLKQVLIHIMIEDTKFGESYFNAWIGGESAPSAQRVNDLVLKLMYPRPGDKILDVGCGKGMLGSFLVQQEPSIEMVFSDFSAEAKKYVRDRTFVQCSMASMPFPDETFDKIFCIHVLAHFADGELGIKEAFRVLKKGGKLMIFTPNKWYVYLSWIMTAIKKTQSGRRSKYDPTARWLYGKRKLRGQLNTCPWSSIEYSYFESAPRLLPFEWVRPKLIAVATK